jgi:hypothetical protein
MNYQPLHAASILALAGTTLALFHLGCGGVGAARGPTDAGTPADAGDPRITRFPLDFGPWMIAAGPDGNLWFTEREDRFTDGGELAAPAARIARTTLAGDITEFSLPAGSDPGGSLPARTTRCGSRNPAL